MNLKAAIAVILCAATLAGCNTVAGVGRDITGAAESFGAGPGY